MKFWEAMRALEEGKAVTRTPESYIYKYVNNKVHPRIRLKRMILGTDVGEWMHDKVFTSLDTEADDWEIAEEPDLYWQWRTKSGIILHYGGFFTFSIHDSQKHAGPWIKTENGFKKHETWEQY